MCDKTCEMSGPVASVTAVFSQKMEPDDQVSVPTTSCTSALLDKTLPDEDGLTQRLPWPRLTGQSGFLQTSSALL